MSQISDVILIINIQNDNESEKIRFLNVYLLSQQHLPLDQSHANGGEKVFTGSVYIGSFNCFDVTEFLIQVRRNFDGEDDAYQVLVREQDLYHFKLADEKIPKWI